VPFYAKHWWLSVIGGANVDTRDLTRLFINVFGLSFRARRLRRIADVVIQ
jgi:hypothetical protein